MRLQPSVDSLGDLHFPAVFARIETRDGHRAFAHLDTARAVTMELVRTATLFQVEPIAYCVLPSHVTVLLAGRVGEAEPNAALRRWKQLSGGAYRRRTQRTLWKPRCRARQLNEPAELWDVAIYLVHEPVRRRLVRQVRDYRWLSAPAAVLSHLHGSGRAPRRPEWWPSEASRDPTSECRSGRSSPR
jgi:hypothetical protein